MVTFDLLPRSESGVRALNYCRRRKRKDWPIGFTFLLSLKKLHKMSVEEDHDNVMSEEDITVVESMTVQEQASRKRKLTSKVWKD
ncbi:hypothetical protein MKW98_006669 [Papaver atlanticum]|uniref:Uncharacterized protein n=1 Tax=Papaver atlanticum TaxID=357466 RepID=A0AAD4T0H7_9MAGN|nr:hypothetical protein MKW98_006669 [Papaver atlanticum]